MDFVLTTGIQHAFASKWDGGAICTDGRQPELGKNSVSKRLYRRQAGGE